MPRGQRSQSSLTHGKELGLWLILSGSWWDLPCLGQKEISPSHLPVLPWSANSGGSPDCSTFPPPWPLRMSRQVKRDYAETDESSGGRKPGTDIHEDARRGSQRNPCRACQKQPPGRRHFLQGVSWALSECLGQMGSPCHCQNAKYPPSTALQKLSVCQKRAS